jgi:hypothetical protein
MRRARVKASRVLAGAWACPPLWANPMGGLRSDSTIHPSSPVGAPARPAGPVASDLVTVVWVLLAVVVLVSCYFLLKVVKQLGKTMGALVVSMEELGEVAADLQRLKGEVQGDGQSEAPEQNGSVDDASRQ